MTTLSTDLLFWIVISDLFLTTTKGMTTFQVLLIGLVGGFGCLILYPLFNLIIRKMGCYWSSIIGSAMFVMALTIFMCANTLWGFFAASLFYNSAIVFVGVRSVLLKNNLKAQGKDEHFVKIQSWALLGYSIITCVISATAGYTFNVNPYLPVLLGLILSIIGFVLSFFYKDSQLTQDLEERELEKKKFDFEILKSKKFIILFIAMFVMFGSLSFMLTKSNLLIQTVLEAKGMEVSRLSIILTWTVFASRIVRIISDLVFPHIFKRVKNKPHVLLVLTLLFIVSATMMSVGAVLELPIWASVLILGGGLCLMLGTRDGTTIVFEWIALKFCSPKQQASVISMLNMLKTVGSKFFILLALLVMLGTTLNYAYLVILPVAFMSLGLIFVLYQQIRALEKQEKNNQH